MRVEENYAALFQWNMQLNWKYQIRVQQIWLIPLRAQNKKDKAKSR